MSKKWDKLSIKDKALYIKLGVSNGIRDLNTIRDTYNNMYDENYKTMYNEPFKEPANKLSYAYGGHLNNLEEQLSLYDNNLVNGYGNDLLMPLLS